MFDFDIYAQFGYQGHEYGLVPEHHAFSTIYKMPETGEPAVQPTVERPGIHWFERCSA